jgi:hypothetical protein
MKKNIFLLALVFLFFFTNAQTFRIQISPQLKQSVLDGRLLLLISSNNSKEPRFQISDALNTQMVFGKDVENWQTGISQLISEDAFGYPVERLNNIPAGNYYVQALLHKYETFHLKTGQTVKLPMDRGEGQHWNEAPGNIYSIPVKMHIDPKSSNEISITLDKTILPIKEPEDTKYIKHVKIQSKLLTEFWGRPMYLGAHILLPHGFDQHTNVKYPLAIFHGHFPSDFGGFRMTPPDSNLKPDTSERFHIIGYNKIQQNEEYNFFSMSSAV